METATNVQSFTDAADDEINDILEEITGDDDD